MLKIFAVSQSTQSRNASALGVEAIQSCEVGEELRGRDLDGGVDDLHKSNQAVVFARQMSSRDCECIAIREYQISNLARVTKDWVLVVEAVGCPLHLRLCS